jgi:23S rRNA pseudouridine1911/1915/1917 synthase
MKDSEWVVGAGEAGVRLDKFLAAPERAGSRGRAATALERGKVLVNGAEASVRDAARRLVDGDVVRVWVDRPGTSKRRPDARLDANQTGDLRILFEDDDLLVLNKPAGVLAVPLERKREHPSIYDQVEDYFRSHGKRRPFVVHRIDRDTSGLVVFAKHAQVQEALKNQFRRREPERVYCAIVYGHPEPAAGTWRDHLAWDQTALIQKETHPRDPRAKEAISDYKVIERFRDTSRLEIRLQTGRRNQIRIQARLRGHTLIGERRYVYGPDQLRPITFSRQALHAARLAFHHPKSGQPMAFEAPLPPDMKDLLVRLRKG